MIISEKLYQDIKDLLSKQTDSLHDTTIHSIVDIRYEDGINYGVNYICFKKYNNQISIDQKYKSLNLIHQIRDSKLEEILNNRSVDFDIEDYIYTDEERDKLHKLRLDNSCKSESLLKVRKEFSESFKIGQRVWYSNLPGILTFKHLNKNDEQICRWSVRIKDVEYRYVSGLLIAPRDVKDLSHIEIDPDLNKLSTEKLLVMMKKKRERYKGYADPKIKRILQDREHVRLGENRIVIVS